MTRRWRSLLLSSCLAATALAFALAMAEVGVRLLAPQPKAVLHHDPYGLAMHWPGLETYLPDFGHKASFNSAGMRDRDHEVEKPSGVFRILLLGDSFMEALQVPFEASFPSRLERALEQQMGRPVEVISAGVSGWGTDDELRYLTQYGLKWRPDLVLVAMTLHNDISDNLQEYWHTIHGDSLVEQPRPRKSFLGYKVVQLKTFLATRFQLYQLWRKVRHGRAMRDVGTQLRSHIVELFRNPTPADIARGFLLTDLLLSKILRVAEANDSRVALVLLPLRVQLSDKAFTAFTDAAGVTTGDMDIDKPQSVLKHIAERLQIPVIDLLPRFRRWFATNEGTLYVEHDGHWNETGHQVAADSTAVAIIAAGIPR